MLGGDKGSAQNQNGLSIRSVPGRPQKRLLPALTPLQLADRCFRHRSLRLPIEEQGLTDHRLDCIGAERLGDEERRLGRLPRKKAFGKGSYENNRDFFNSKNR